MRQAPEKEYIMFRLGGMEWIIILVIIVILFGPGRIGNVAGELGKSIKAFRDGMSGDDKKNEQPTDSKNNIEPK
jgi:sec-independent protein translocase protein TatA